MNWHSYLIIIISIQSPFNTTTSKFESINFSNLSAFSLTPDAAFRRNSKKKSFNSSGIKGYYKSLSYQERRPPRKRLTHLGSFVPQKENRNVLDFIETNMQKQFTSEFGQKRGHASKELFKIRIENPLKKKKLSLRSNRRET